MSCTRCGRDAPTAELAFHTHVGLVVLFHHTRDAGRFCRACARSLFTRSTIVTGLFGWWGVISLFVTLFFALPMNVMAFVRARSLAPPEGAPPRPAARERGLRFGIAPVVLGVWAFVHLSLTAGLLGAFVAVGPQPDIVPYWAHPLVILLPDVVLTFVYGALTFVSVARVAAGTRGRARLLVLSWAAMFRALGMGVVAALLAVAMTDTSAVAFGLGATEPFPLGLNGLWDTLLMVTAAQGTMPVLIGALALTFVAFDVERGAAIVSWFLIPARVRAVFWTIIDVVLLAGFVAVTLLLPIDAPPNGDLTLPIIRLLVTTLAAVRLLWRLLPYAMDAAEQGGFRLIVAARMLRARKSGFLTAIGALSIMAVAFSSCTLTTTLSVMGGFRNDLKRKILGNHAHVVIDRERGTFEDWRPALETIRAQEGVVGATPYVQGEVMITSATNLSGAILRGIDPATIGDVTELPDNMRHGQLEYLSHPERLLRLRAEEMGRGLLAPPMRIDPDAAPNEGRRGFLDDAEDVLGIGVDPVPAPPPIPRLDEDARRLEHDIDPFLLDDPEPPPAAAPAEEAEPEVLPGLIVGQELARTLRLHVGDTVDVVSPHGELGPTGPLPKSRPFRVAGIFYSGMYEFDMKMAYTTIEDAQRFLDVGSAVHGIEVKLDDAERAEPVARALAAAIDRDELRVRAWQEVNRSLFGALQLEKLAMFIVLGLAILVASFCILASLILMVQEKGKEIGILKAMGATAEQIVAVFMAQGLMIGVLGAAIGLGLGYLACFAAENFGMIPLQAEVYYIDRLPVHVDGVEFALVGVAAVIICLLATIYPALLGSRLRPVDALRYS